MIYTEFGFKQTQELIANMELALADLRRRVLPINPQKYHIMAKGCISQILAMRAEIDEYLGIVSSKDSKPKPQTPAHV